MLARTGSDPELYCMVGFSYCSHFLCVMLSYLDLRCFDMGISSIVGKSRPVHGAVHDATPFKFSEEKGHDVDAIDFFARQLETAGYNYYGTETMYSGTDGVPMKASGLSDI